MNSSRLSERAKVHTKDALQTLVDIAINGREDAARISAANAILDRAYGKPTAKEKKQIVDLPPAIIELAGVESSKCDKPDID